MQIVPEDDLYVDKEQQNGYKSIAVVTKMLDKCILKYQQENFNGIFGHPSFGFESQDFDFAGDFKNAKLIWFWEVIVSDIAGLYSLKDVEYFGVSGKRPMIDFSHLPNLKTLVLHWGHNDFGVGKCKNIELFNLWHHKPKDKSFASFEFPVSAKKVGLFWTNVENLTTLNGLKGMTEVSIERAKNLKSLRGLEAYSETLEYIKVDSCGKLGDFEFILDFPNLKGAYINRVKIK